MVSHILESNPRKRGALMTNSVGIYRPRSRKRSSYFSLLPMEAVQNVVRHTSARPSDVYWRAWICLCDARAMLLAGGRLSECVRLEIGMRPHDLYFALLPDEIVNQVLRHVSARPRGMNWQTFVQPKHALELIRGGGRLGYLTRAELVDRLGKQPHDLLFDLLPEDALRHVLRFVSSRPKHRQWQAWVTPKDLNAVYGMGGRIAAMARKEVVID